MGSGWFALQPQGSAPAAPLAVAGKGQLNTSATCNFTASSVPPMPPYSAGAGFAAASDLQIAITLQALRNNNNDSPLIIFIVSRNK